MKGAVDTNTVAFESDSLIYPADNEERPLGLILSVGHTLKNERSIQLLARLARRGFVVRDFLREGNGNVEAVLSMEGKTREEAKAFGERLLVALEKLGEDASGKTIQLHYLLELHHPFNHTKAQHDRLRKQCHELGEASGAGHLWIPSIRHCDKPFYAQLYYSHHASVMRGAMNIIQQKKKWQATTLMEVGAFLEDLDANREKSRRLGMKLALGAGGGVEGRNRPKC